LPDTALWTLWAAKEAAFKAAVKLKPGLTFRHREYAVANLAPGAFPESVPAVEDRRTFRSVTYNRACSWTAASGREGRLPAGRAVVEPFPPGNFFPDGRGQTPEIGQGKPFPSGEAAGSGTPSISGYGAVMTPMGLMDVLFSVSPLRVHCLALGGNGAERGVRRIHWQEEKRSGAFDPSGAVRRAAIHYLAEALRTSPYFLAIRRPRTTSGESGPPRVFLEGRETDIDLSLTHDGAYLAFAVRLGHDAW